QTPAIAATAIGGHQEAFGFGIESFPFMAPPSPNRGYGEGAGVMISPDIHEPGVVADIVDAVGIRAGHIGVGKVMPAHLFWLLGRKPLLPAVVVIADEFLLLCVHGNHRRVLLNALLHGGTDVPELCVTIGMVFSFLGLTVTLQAVAQIAQNLAYFDMADRMLAPGQDIGNSPRALQCPTQWRFGIPPRLGTNHRLQLGDELGISLSNRLATTSGAADSTFQCLPRLNFLHAFADSLARQAACTADQSHASPT